MEESSPPPPPTTVRRNPYRRARHTPFVPESLSRFNAEAVANTLQPFSLDDDPETVPLPPLPSPSPSPSPAKPSDHASSSNLKVFLRIRPTEIKPQPRPGLRARNPKPRTRANQSPQKATKKNKLTEVCLAVNGPESVTLTIPKSKLVDSRRGNKSEIYDGFSFVFPPESLQTDVYDKVMNPLVKDFIGGKSALLVAMGPTGSGKTHTMFGSNRDPGLVPLALKKIFSTGEKNPCQPRSFYLAMLEIYSVSGKGEKMIDLLSDGTDLTLVQSAIKGLEEVPISDLEGAERLVARGMLKRSTAATDANSQSSRSQCIITIRRAKDVFNTGKDMLFGNGVLVIADLAGAERDKKTGNMGSRLGESHFINNTSMVFGLCLRSLLEHQKNPKRPLEMHYKNSLLTRYLKEYLEGKKRMTLIITVKPGEEDYVDTSFVLRQAAPYMKIKYTAIEEVNVPPVQKRSNIAVAQQGNKKRRKICGELPVDHPLVATEIHEKEKLEAVQATVNSITPNTDATVETTGSNDALDAELQKAKRNEVIMTQFARAFWKTLKLYKEKLLNSESEILSMRQLITEKDRQIMELEGNLAKVISCQNQSEQEISCLDGSNVENTGSVSELTETTNDWRHFKSPGHKNSSAGSTKRGTPSNSSNSATDSSSILVENSMPSDCEQATVLSIKIENEDKHSENVIDEVTEKVCPSFAAEPECFPEGNPRDTYSVDGNPLKMVCLDSNNDEGLMFSTENETRSSFQLVKAKVSKAADTSPLVIEARRRNIEFSGQHADSSRHSIAEGSDGKLILISEEPTGGSDFSASIALGKIDLTSDFKQETVLLDDKKKSENLVEEEKDDTSCNYITEKHCDPDLVEGDILQMVCSYGDTDEGKYLSTENEIQWPAQLHEVLKCTYQSADLPASGFAEVSKEKLLSFEDSKEMHFGDMDPLEMVCQDSDNDEGQMLALENESKPCTKCETCASEISEHSPTPAIAARRKGIEFLSACKFEENIKKESGPEGDLSFEGLIEELKHDIPEQILAEAALAKNISALNLCQTIQKAEVTSLMNNEIYDEDKSNIIEKEENCGTVINLEHPELLPDQIVREKPFSKDDLLQMVCPDSDSEEQAMLSTEKTTEFPSQHIEGKASDIEISSPLVTKAKRQSIEFSRKRNSSSGGYFASGSETRKAISFEGSKEEESENTLEQGGAGEDAASSNSLKSQEIFQEFQADTQLDLMIGSPQQLKQDSSSSYENLKLELENKRSANCEEPREETRQDSVGGNSDMPVIVEPKKESAIWCWLPCILFLVLASALPNIMAILPKLIGGWTKPKSFLTAISSLDPEEHHLTSLDHDGKSSIERRKENQPIKSLIEVIGKENRAYPSKPFIARKPKRRLRPASSMLLKELTSPDMDPDVPKDGRGKTTNETRSEGSMSLIQLLTKPIREKNI